MHPRIAAAVYFGIQRVRGGVSKEQIRRAAALLQSPHERVAQHILQRLCAVHGARAAEEEGWLSRQPLVERTELLPVIDELRSTGKLRGVEFRRTSGSTATPYSFVKDSEMTAWMDAAMWAVYSWHGIRPGDRQARFWGMPLQKAARRKRWLTDRLQNRRRMSAFQISPERSLKFFSEMRAFRPAYAYGYPNLIHEFVEHCSSAGVDGADLGLRAVICTGEMLTPVVREQLHTFFKAPVVNEYGCTESGIVAFECEYGTSHPIPVAVVAQVVDSEGASVESGENGEVVITDLYGRVLPLLRYRLRDRAQWDDRHACPCGRSLPALQVSEGRVYHMIRRREGDPVYANILGYTVPEEVLRFRGIQRSLDRLDVHIIAKEGCDPARTAAECQRRWQQALGESLQVNVVVVDAEEIPYPASGKLQYFVPLSSDQGGRIGATIGT